jgi:hypothetical protein
MFVFFVFDSAFNTVKLLFSINASFIIAKEDCSITSVAAALDSAI